MRKAFLTYGFDLKDKGTENKLNIPKTLNRLSDFKLIKETVHTPEYIDELLNIN